MDRDPALRLEGITKRFGDVTAVDDLSLSVAEGEFVTLLGPSGCGKTTALRLVAGFEAADAGRIRFRGEDVAAWSPQRRGFGMVFQNYALFPHLDVDGNVAFGLRSRRRPRPEIATRVEAALERVDLAGLGRRAVQALSGGQQQRVALARALAIEPPLLLLDEPFSNLDAALRERTRGELRRLVKDLGITAVFVTHDQEEAFDLSDRIAVMDRGRLRQIGTPRDLYLEPADRFVAGFVGRANVLAGTVEAEGDGLAVRLEAGPRWSVPPPDPSRHASARDLPGRGVRCVVMVRPEGFALTGADATAPVEGIPGSVRDRRFLGAYTVSYVETEAVGTIEVVEVGEGAAVGDRVRVVPAQGGRLHVFPAPPGEGR